jgi:hypothetical protein
MEAVMNLHEALEELLAVSVSAYVDSSRRSPQLKDSIELVVRTLDEWDRQRNGIARLGEDRPG